MIFPQQNYKEATILLITITKSNIKEEEGKG
jgi:hypothetical protein